MITTTRRRVLRFLVNAATVGAAGTQRRVLATAPDQPRLSSDWRCGLETIGAAYVRQHYATGQDTRRNDTVTEALRRLGIRRATAATLLASGRGPHFSATVQADFARNNTTDVEGWVLSTTEVAVALVAWGEQRT